MSDGRATRTAARSVMVLGAAAGTWTAVAPTPAQAGPIGDAVCDAGLGNIIPGCDLVVGGAETVGNAIDFASDPVGYFTDLFTDAASGFFQGVGRFILGSGDVDLTDPAFVTPYAAMFGVSLFVSVAQLAHVFGWGRTLLHQVWAAPGWLLYVTMSVAFPVFVFYGLRVLDFAIDPFTHIANDALTRFMDALSTMDDQFLIGFGLPAKIGVLLVMAIVFIIVAVVLFLELIIRSGLIYVLVLFYPIFALGYIEYKDGQSEGRQRLSTFHTIIVGIALMKWVIAVVLTLAASLFLTGDPDKMLIAVGLIIVSVFTPFAIIPLIGFTQGAHAGSAVTQGLGRAARTARRRR